MLKLNPIFSAVLVSEFVVVSVQLKIRVDEQCKVLCRIESLSQPQVKAFKTKIEDEYRVNM